LRAVPSGSCSLPEALAARTVLEEVLDAVVLGVDRLEVHALAPGEGAVAG
jgi:hypothetical protein